MKVSESWKNCGHPFEDKRDFGMGKDRLSSKQSKSPKEKYSPSKEKSCPSGDDVFIRINWRLFYFRAVKNKLKSP